MADQFTAVIKEDGSATISVVFDITGTGLPSYKAVNTTTFTLAAPQDTVDSSGNVTAAVPWTQASAIAEVTTQAAIVKAAWVASELSAG